MSGTHERRYHGGVERLRRPERLAWLEVGRVAGLATEGLHHPSVLDVGTGSGIFAEAFAGLGLDVKGVDVDEEMVAAARRLVPGAAFAASTAEALPYAGRTFDLVFMGLLLHEADDRVRALAEASRVARRRVVALEWPHLSQEIGPPREHRVSGSELSAIAAEVGLQLVRAVPLEVLVVFTLELRLRAGGARAPVIDI